jgi:outer membrane protein assembly factor BamD (BamD/ComL family)
MRKIAVLIAAILPLFGCSRKIPSERELFDKASKFEATQEYNKALEAYRTLIDNYPQSPNRYKAIFMTGYIESEYLKDSKKAVEAFDKILKEYPTSDLSDDARILRDAAISGRDLMSVFRDSTKTQ